MRALADYPHSDYQGTAFQFGQGYTCQLPEDSGGFGIVSGTYFWGSPTWNEELGSAAKEDPAIYAISGSFIKPSNYHLDSGVQGSANIDQKY